MSSAIADKFADVQRQLDAITARLDAMGAPVPTDASFADVLGLVGLDSADSDNDPED